jgi:hypothetical protein
MQRTMLFGINWFIQLAKFMRLFHLMLRLEIIRMLVVHSSQTSVSVCIA